MNGVEQKLEGVIRLRPELWTEADQNDAPLLVTDFGGRDPVVQIFVTPDPADRLYLVSFDEARSLPDLLPSGVVIEAAAVSCGPFVAIATANPPGLELQRLPIATSGP